LHFQKQKTIQTPIHKMMLQTSVNANALSTFEDMRMGKGTYRKFLVMQMKEGTIQLDEELNKLTTLDELTANLPSNSSRFICYHLSFEMPSSRNGPREGKRTKMVFVVWCPQETNVREKFQLAATCKTVKSHLNGLSVTLHATTKGEVNEQDMIEKCLAFMK